MAAKVLEVTLEQKDELDGRKYNNSGWFNVVEDADGKFFISKEERDACDYGLNPDLAWIMSLSEIDHNPVVEDI